MKKRKKSSKNNNQKKKIIISLLITLIISFFLIGAVYFPEHSEELKNTPTDIKSVFLPSLYSKQIPHPGHGGDDVFIKINNQEITLQNAINDNYFDDQCGYTGGILKETSTGHTGNEIIVNLNNQQKTLQQAINDSSLSSLSNTGNSPASYNQIPYGHPASEILIDFNGEKTLQQAINQGDFENQVAGSQYSSGYSIDYLVRQKGGGFSSGKVTIKDTKVIQTDNKYVYSTSQGDWSPTNTHTESLRLNVIGEGYSGDKDANEGVKVVYRVYDNTEIRIKSKAWAQDGGGKNLKLDRLDTFKKQSQNEFLINGDLQTINPGDIHEVQRVTWKPPGCGGSNHNSGESYVKVRNNICADYFDVIVMARERDEECDSAKIWIESYIEPA